MKKGKVGADMRTLSRSEVIKKLIRIFHLHIDNAMVSLSDLLFIAMSSFTKVTAVRIEGSVPENCSK